MNKDRYQSTSARRALALLNSPQVEGITIPTEMLAARAPQAKTQMPGPSQAELTADITEK